AATSKPPTRGSWPRDGPRRPPVRCSLSVSHKPPPSVDSRSSRPHSAEHVAAAGSSLAGGHSRRWARAPASLVHRSFHPRLLRQRSVRLPGGCGAIRHHEGVLRGQPHRIPVSDGARRALVRLRALRYSLVGLLCSLGCIALACVLGTRAYDRKTGLVAAAILAVMPLEIFTWSPLLVDSVTPVYWGATLGLFYLGLPDNQRRARLLLFAS